MIMRGL